jgi:hypothetical protein
VKIRITFKDPDGTFEGVRQASYDGLPEGLTDEERDDAAHLRGIEINEDLKKWVRYGEYVDIDFDLEAGTATVVPVR